MALITTSEAKSMIPMLSGSGDDSLISTLITVTDRMIAQHLGYPPATAGSASTAESTSYTLYLDGPGGRELTIPIWPVTSITSIYDSVDRRYAAADLVASTDYTLVEGQNGLVELDWDAQHGTFSEARRSIKVTFTAGWATVPEDIKHAAKLTVRHLWGHRQTAGKTTEGINGLNTSYVDPTSLPKEAKDILAPYRLPGTVVPV